MDSLGSNMSLEEQIWLTKCIYLTDYFKLRKKKKKQNEMSFLITWQVYKQQVNKYQSFATMEPYLTNPGKKTGLTIKRHVGVREIPK